MVEQYHDHHGSVLIGKESAWGTAVSATLDVGLMQDLTWNANINYKKNYSFASTQIQSTSSGSYGITGSMEVLFQHGRLIQYIMGTVANTTSGTDYTHTYTFNDTLPSFTMEDGYNGTADITNILKGCKLNTWTLSLGIDGTLTQKVDFFARDVDPSGTTASAASIDTLDTRSAFDSTLSFGTISSEAVVSNLQSFELTISRIGGGDPTLYGFSSRLAQAYEANQSLITFRFTIGFDSVTELQAFLGNTSGILTTANTELTAKGLVFNSQNATAYGSGQQKIDINLSGVYLEAGTHRHAIGNYIFQDFQGFATTIDSFTSVDDITSSGATFY